MKTFHAQRRRRLSSVVVAGLCLCLVLTAVAWGFQLWNRGWSRIPVPFLINSTGAPTGFSSAIQNGHLEWNYYATERNFRFVYDGTTTKIIENFYYNDGLNDVFWSPSGTGMEDTTLAMTMAFTNSQGNVDEYNMIFNGIHAWSTTGAAGSYDLQSVALHEAGHALGLAHTGVSGAVMLPSIGAGVVKRTPAPDDLAGYRELYKNALQDDGFEENDTRQTATNLTAGRWRGLVALDDDWYRVTVPGRKKVTLQVLFQHANGDLDLRAYDSGGTELASSTSATDVESLTLENSATVSDTVYFRIYPYRGMADANQYEADLAFADMPAPEPPPQPAPGGGSGSSGGSSAGSSDGGGGGGGCFVATAAYGSAMEPEVVTLRGFRDEYLMPNAAGRALVAAYYRWSPPAAEWISRSETRRAIARMFLWPAVLAAAEPVIAGGILLTGLVGLWARWRRRRPRK